MARLIATSEIGDFLDAGRIYDFTRSFYPVHSELLENFAFLLDSGLLGVDSLSATQIVFSGSAPNGYAFKVTIDGSGIDPVATLADLQAAFEAGLANGSFSKITVEGSKSATFPGDTSIANADILTIDISATGYTMTSGAQVLDVTGTVPTSLEQFYDLSVIARQLMVFDTLSEAQKTQIITDLNAYDFENFSFSSGTTEVFSLASGATEASLTLLGYKVTVFGDFPANLGDVQVFIYELAQAIFSGTAVDFSDIAGNSVDQVKVFNPDGDVILKTVGNLGTSTTINFGVIKIDDVRVKNAIIGENSANAANPYVPGDELHGTDGVDHMFGLAGNDYLNGGKGNDFLFGGTGSDRLEGGRGSDVLNAGSNKGADYIIGSRGSDTMIFSDSGEGYQLIDYSGFFRGITVVVKGNANTGKVFKGKFGTDTLVDVGVPIKGGGTYPTAGFAIVGSAKSDNFFLTNATDGWMGVRGGDGVDSYTLRLSDGSITRLNMWDATNAVDMDLSSGTIDDDGFGNTETIKLIDRGGSLEIQASRYADTIIGSDLDDRFILREGNDYADGGGGTDLIRYDRGGVGPVNVNLTTETATGTWNGTAFTDTLKNFENIRGSRDGDDVLVGNARGNVIQGRGGDDTLTGRTGRDKLYGEDGNDRLIGGKGKDTLTGGAGNDRLIGGGKKDVFVFNGTLDEGRDVITDFQDGLDRIRIEGGDTFDDLTIKKTGGGSSTLITLDSGTEIVVRNVVKADIDIDDFQFFLL